MSTHCEEWVSEPSRIGIIFDMDGVLIDSYRQHLESWQLAGRHDGVNITEAAFAHTFGRTSRETIELLWHDHDLNVDRIREIDARKESIFRDLIRTRIPIMNGAELLIERVRSQGWRVAIGSSGPPENVQLVVEALGGHARFHAVVTGADVEYGKPAPDVFVLAAQRCETPATRCVVIEDAPAGVEAATRAGMQCIALLSTGRHRSDFEMALQRPARFVRELPEITIDGILALLNERTTNEP